MTDPGFDHWEAVKWILRYLKGTSTMTLCFKQGKVILQGFVDADLGGKIDNRKSTSGYVFTINGTAVSWRSEVVEVCSTFNNRREECIIISA